MMAHRTLIILASVLLVGCAQLSSPPPSPDAPVAIRTPPPSNPQPQAVQQALARYDGQAVRWGGSVIGVQPEAQATLLEVQAYRLDRRGQPSGYPQSGVRFVTRVPHSSIQPYAPGQFITVAGVVSGSSVIEHYGRYVLVPMVNSTASYVWSGSGSAVTHREPEYDDYGYGHRKIRPRVHIGIGVGRGIGGRRHGRYGVGIGVDL